ncbi:stalk domain-containing protein [Alkaliphilus pronyensis]|nr:stalk domain-containing protein [Alkaliphilus pronyensis]
MLKPKKVLFSIILIILYVSIANYSFADNYKEIKIYVDDKPLSFDTGAYKINNRVMVPFRGILEAFGAQVGWDENTKTVTAYKDGIVIKLSIGSTTAYKNTTAYKLDVPPQIINSRTFIPVRFVSEALGMDVKWDGKNQSVYIVDPSIPFSFKDISIGTTLASVEDKLGKPIRVDSSEYDFDWYIYHNRYMDYLQIGIKDRRVVALYSNNLGWKNHYNIDVNASKKNIRNILKDSLVGIIKGNTIHLLPPFEAGKEEYYLYQLNNGYVTIFFDLHNNDRVSAIQLIAKESEETVKEFNYMSSSLKLAFEKQSFDLVNASRAKMGLAPLEWCASASDAAYKHSLDMAVNSFFGHENLYNKSVSDRLKAEGINYRRAGENIAAGHQNAIYAHENLLNSEGHRKMILGEFEKLGVGVHFGGPYNVYFTQNYYAKK